MRILIISNFISLETDLFEKAIALAVSHPSQVLEMKMSDFMNSLNEPIDMGAMDMVAVLYLNVVQLMKVETRRSEYFIFPLLVANMSNLHSLEGRFTDRDGYNMSGYPMFLETMFSSPYVLLPVLILGHQKLKKKQNPKSTENDYTKDGTYVLYIFHRPSCSFFYYDPMGNRPHQLVSRRVWHSLWATSKFDLSLEFQPPVAMTNASALPTQTETYMTGYMVLERVLQYINPSNTDVDNGGPFPADLILVKWKTVIATMLQAYCNSCSGFEQTLVFHNIRPYNYPVTLSGNTAFEDCLEMKNIKELKTFVESVSAALLLQANQVLQPSSSRTRFDAIDMVGTETQAVAQTLSNLPFQRANGPTSETQPIAQYNPQYGNLEYLDHSTPPEPSWHSDDESIDFNDYLTDPLAQGTDIEDEDLSFMDASINDLIQDIPLPTEDIPLPTEDIVEDDNEPTYSEVIHTAIKVVRKVRRDLRKTAVELKYPIGFFRTQNSSEIDEIELSSIYPRETNLNQYLKNSYNQIERLTREIRYVVVQQQKQDSEKSDSTFKSSVDKARYQQSEDNEATESENMTWVEGADENIQLRHHFVLTRNPTTSQVSDWFMTLPSPTSRKSTEHTFMLSKLKKRPYRRYSPRQYFDLVKGIEHKASHDLAVHTMMEGIGPDGRMVEIDYGLESINYNESHLKVSCDIDSFIMVLDDFKDVPLHEDHPISWVLSTNNYVWSKTGMDDVWIPFSRLPTDTPRFGKEKRFIQALTCPKVMIGRFGAAGDGVMLICFPLMRKLNKTVWQDFPCKEDLWKLYEKLFRVAFQYYDEEYEDNISSRIPSNYKVLTAQSRMQETGRYSERRMTMNCKIFKRVLAFFPEIIHNDPQLSIFKGCFIHIHGKALKLATQVPLSDFQYDNIGFRPERLFQNAFQAIDWELVRRKYATNCYFDIGFEYLFKAENATEALQTVGVWDILKVHDFFKAQHLKVGYIDRDVYSHQIGGKRCTVKIRPYQLGRTPVVRAQCYSTVKATSYSHKSATGLFDFQIQELLASEPDKFLKRYNEASEIFRKNIDMSFAARLEYRINGFEFPCGTDIKAQSDALVEYQPFYFVDSYYYHTNILCRMHAYKVVVTRCCSIFKKSNRLGGELRALVACMIHLFKALISRPNDRSWSREISK